MTQRIKGFVVTLDADYRDDDIEKLAEAVRCLRGVVSVTMTARDPGDEMNRRRIENELREKLFKVFDEVEA